MDTRKNYELAVHININMDEARLAQIRSELEEIITKGGGAISYSKEPERTRLSYELAHQTHSFFGYIQFNTENGELLPQLEEYIKLNNDILRSLILKLPSDAKKNQEMMKQMKAKERIEKRAKSAAQPAPVENKELDKELEDIIEKL
ncbi:30S ribosomal protein S6 [Candidatus Parcubacteria bacterium]|nr:30S ribosomal protein S6 [Candidatus Parcubacteria bacterium]